MIQDLESIEYRGGLLAKGMNPGDLKIKKWKRTKIPPEIKWSMIEENILNLGGIYGDKDAGEPMQYEHVKITLTEDTVEVIFFNRAITLLATDDDIHRRLHRFFQKLENYRKQ